jgi:serine/threonine protein kinase
MSTSTIGSPSASPERYAEQSHRYVYQDLINKGPVANLYRGYRERFRMPVMVRTYPGVATLKLISSDVQRFDDELADATPRARGRHLPDVLDMVRGADGTLVVLRVPEGELLVQRLRADRVFTPERTLHILRGVADALAACRRTGVPHRGPTVDRIWLGRHDEVLLLGHGEVMYSRMAMAARGTLHSHIIWHMPPEILRTFGDNNASSIMRMTRLRNETDVSLEDAEVAEVYAMGCLAYYCLRGHHPYFIEQGTNTGSSIQRTLEGNPLEIPDLGTDHPARAVIGRALAQNPLERFQTVDAFVDALQEAWDLAPVRPSAESETWDEGDDDDDADDEGDDSAADPATPRTAKAAGRTLLWPWVVSTITLGLGVAAALLLNLMRPTTVLITSQPPRAALELVTGHTSSPLGTTPVLLSRDDLIEPITLQVVADDGTRGERQTLHPVDFDDLGRCRRLDLVLEFDEPTP